MLCPSQETNRAPSKTIYESPIEPSCQINKREYKYFTLALYDTIVTQTYYFKNLQSLCYPTV